MNKLRRFATWLAPTLFLRDTKTVHYAFSLLFFVVAAIGMSAVIGSEASYITLVSNTSVVEAGEEFSIDVTAYANEPVNALNLTITFPSDMVEVLSVDRGQSVITLWTEDPKVVGNSVILSGGTYRKGFVGEHLIATINVRAKQTGRATFLADKAELLAGDGKGTVVDTDLSKSKISLVIGEEKKEGTPPRTEVSTTLVIVSDIDGDGEVDLSDISTFMSAWFNKTTTYDFNGDGAMTFRDFSIILAKFVAP